MIIDDVVDLVEPEVTGAPRATIRNAVVMAARDLCTEADIWPETVAAYVPKGRQEADIDAPDEHAEILRIDSVGGVSASLYRQSTPSTLTLKGSTSESRRLSVSVVCRPKMTAKTLPEQLGRWSEALMYGALYRLLKMPGQAWANLQLAADYRMQFQAQIFEAKRLSAVGHQNGSRAVKMRPFV